jgi:hypothetical protein
MHQPSFVDVDIRLLGRSRTYKFEITDPINSPMDVNPLHPSQQHPGDLIPPVCSSPTDVDSQGKYVCSYANLTLFVHPSMSHAIGNYPKFPAVKSRRSESAS